MLLYSCPKATKIACLNSDSDSESNSEFDFDSNLEPNSGLDLDSDLTSLLLLSLKVLLKPSDDNLDKLSGENGSLDNSTVILNK